MTRLFIPGPTDVHPQSLKAQSQAMIGHRSPEFAALFGRIQPKLKKVFQTKNRVFVTASSGTGLFEGALRNTVSQRLLICVCGAFGERWVQAAQANNLPADRIAVDWGHPNTPDQVEEALKTGEYDTLALVHNETSTGVENPVPKILAMAHSLQPDLITLVDAVSSAGGVDIQPDAWGIDVLVTSSQKCFALPPGLAFAAVSDRALERAEKVPSRGWYFDFLLLEKYLQRNMTPATPAISLLYALDLQLDRMLAEGLLSRFRRHAAMAKLTQEWAKRRFDLFAAEGCYSNTVTAVKNTRNLEIPALINYLAQRGMIIADGYGKLKGKTFRIGHMGERQLSDLEELLEHIDHYLSAS